ncbi:SMI1/KNR4 family protein [Actinacidiphila sp. ITFR-21]|uniref:SMI1/KNR4 family protein n=1 Tax=Actinacidiphila sp. ITFR-21 TaxID=3075199 RepID=UPI00288B98E1|nr:SMI1/KNR4 family protein [Streptomyces sp. ITFR-21]WNI16350.1 SMI1/KNR4 family protein [Streptomyces sp. ITFR-21]
MTDLSALFARVRSRAERQNTELPPCAGEQDVARAESDLGFALPPVLSGLYRRVANGGFGPEYLLFPLTGHGRTAVAEYGPLRTAASAYWPHGVLPILDWGCGMYAAVDCLHPDGQVLVFEPNAGPDDWADAWFQDSPSLAQWLLNWLNGTGWWEEDGTVSDDAAALQPQPWPDAARRLAGAGRR